MNEYTHIALDVLNVAYRLFFASSEKSRTLCKVSNKLIYKELVRDFIELVNFWSSKFGKDAEIYLLFDNPTSRDELKSLFQPLSASASRKEKFPEYKSNRKPASKEFYNSVDLIKWYYMMTGEKRFTVRINHVEADDLVKPFIDYVRDHYTSSKILLVTNDSDWCRFIDEGIDYLPEFYEEPQTVKDFGLRYGYLPTEDSIVLHKIVYGDAADNIHSAFFDLDKSQKDFIVSKFSSVQELYANLGTLPKELQLYCKEQENKVRAAYQMVSLIPIQKSHFEASLVKGRDAKAYVDTLHKLLELNQETGKESFNFGFLPYPRLDPKDSRCL